MYCPERETSVVAVAKTHLPEGGFLLRSLASSADRAGTRLNPLRSYISYILMYLVTRINTECVVSVEKKNSLLREFILSWVTNSLSWVTICIVFFWKNEKIFSLALLTSFKNLLKNEKTSLIEWEKTRLKNIQIKLKERCLWKRKII